MKSYFRYSTLLPLVCATVTFGLVPAAIAGGRQDSRTGADPTVEVVANGHGRINYAAGVVKATGYGAPPKRSNSPSQARLMARGAALADALRTLAMTVSSIQVTATTRVKNYELQKDEVETRLSALLQSPQIVSESFQPDGTAVVVVNLPMYGRDSIASVVLPEVLHHTDEIPVETAGPQLGAPAAYGAGADSNGNFHGPAQPATRVDRVPAPADERGSFRDPGLTSLSDDGPFTSVLVDCRGLNIEAVMSPKLMDTTGREVYGTVHVTPDYAIETGIVGYPRSMRDALRTARAGAHPLIVRALRAADPHRFNPVISLEDADRILAANNRSHFLEQTRVVFLVEPLR
jgi:hypothetical protein